MVGKHDAAPRVGFPARAAPVHETADASEYHSNHYRDSRNVPERTERNSHCGEKRNGERDRDENSSVLGGTPLARVPDVASIVSVLTPAREYVEHSRPGQRGKEQKDRRDIHTPRVESGEARGDVSGEYAECQPDVLHRRVAVHCNAAPLEENGTHALPREEGDYQPADDRHIGDVERGPE